MPQRYCKSFAIGRKKKEDAVDWHRGVMSVQHSGMNRSGFKEMTRPGGNPDILLVMGWPWGFLDGRLVEALNPPAAFQSALVDKNPMTHRQRPWRPARARGAATTRRIIIAMRSLKPVRRHTPWLNKPEFCEFFEHRSPPCPRCAAGQ
jgi:hypothetical protein